MRGCIMDGIMGQSPDSDDSCFLSRYNKRSHPLRNTEVLASSLCNNAGNAKGKHERDGVVNKVYEFLKKLLKKNLCGGRTSIPEFLKGFLE